VIYFLPLKRATLSQYESTHSLCYRSGTSARCVLESTTATKGKFTRGTYSSSITGHILDIGHLRRKRGESIRNRRARCGPRWDGNGTISTASSTRRPREKSTNSSGRGAPGLRRISFRIKELRAIQRKKSEQHRVSEEEREIERERERKREIDWLWSRLR